MSPAELPRLITRAVAAAARLDPKGRVSDSQLARAMGVDRRMVWRWRNGVMPRRRHLEELRKLAEARA